MYHPRQDSPHLSTVVHSEQVPSSDVPFTAGRFARLTPCDSDLWPSAEVASCCSRPLPRRVRRLLRLLRTAGLAAAGPRSLPRRLRRALGRKCVRAMAGTALLLTLGTGNGQAASITVTTTTPAINSGDTECSLIEAIINANNDNTTYTNCDAGSGADTIILSAGSTHVLSAVENTTYDVTGLPVISTDITIEGNGATIERDGSAPDFRLFAVGSGGSLTLQKTTLSGGTVPSKGGGVYNKGTLTLTDSTLSGNAATYGGGVWNGGTATSTDSTLSGNTAGLWGGGVMNDGGKATLTKSTLSGNTATYGGGIYNRAGILTLNKDTLSGNSATDNGGGVFNADSLTLTNSTLSGNSATDNGGGVFNNGTATLTNGTLSDNTATSGGGVYNTGTSTLTLARSLLSGNTATTGPEVHNNGGAVTANNYNLFGANTAAGVIGFSPGAPDIVPGIGVLLTDILNPTLANNGGPTETHALVSGSPAIDAVPTANPGCTGTDQRGAVRPQGAGCDTGAMEFAHDLVLSQISKPKQAVTLTTTTPVQTKVVTVKLQNQSSHAETIPDAATLANMVSLQVEALPTPNACPDLTPTLVTDDLVFPLVWAPKTKLGVPFAVTFSTACIPDPLKTTKDTLHNDYRLTAQVDHSVLDGEVDTTPSNDVCPRPAALKDKGCGGKLPNKKLGADVFIDVVEK